jgi:chitin-binding protein
MKIAPGTGGSVHWKLSDGATVLTDSEKTGLATWPANASRLRPKWGIYRSLGDQADVNTTYILLSDMRGHLCQ